MAKANREWQVDHDYDDEADGDGLFLGAQASDAVPRVLAEGVLPVSSVGLRLDQALALLWPQYSRSRLQQWLRSGEILLDGQPAAPRRRVLGGEQVSVDARPEMAERWSAEPVLFDVVHADRQLIVIDKPVGLVVHPGAGNPNGTLVNGLLYRFPELAAVPRAGIVHRLDKDTSGLLVVARTETAHGHLLRQLAERSMGRIYLAVCEGVPTAGFRVDAPIGRDPRNRLRMAVVSDGRPATTHVAVEERFRAHALLRCRLETGRTHQIRAHLRHEGLPLVGDGLYGAKGRLPKMPAAALVVTLRAFRRQALHAARLDVIHPEEGCLRSFEAPLPSDFSQLLAALREDAALGEGGR
ncbi:MAG: 23S rRNA pseudouridine(1911/1915/1917) synthase RluD [Gammaproteobacteria bacterium]|nr:MAG: 23S rRNA pseudouridine(1911/1915/1917) synthase RluD [Gammaproteobacteria bacterium]